MTQREAENWGENHLVNNTNLFNSFVSFDTP